MKNLILFLGSNYNCLMDCINVYCKNVSICRGFRYNRWSNIKNSQKLNNDKVLLNQTLPNFFTYTNYLFLSLASLNKDNNIFNRLIDFDVQVYRNLSSVHHSG